jgi:hypothetical protein
VSIRSDLREGRELGVPLCCRLRWTIEYALNPDGEQAPARGIRLTPAGDEYVPCEIRHEAAVTHAEYEQLLALPGGTISTRALARYERTL